MPGQANVNKSGVHGCKLGIAVGRHINACVGRVVERECEGQHHVGDYVIPVIAGVGRAGHDAVTDLSYHISNNARCRRWSRRRRWACRCCGSWYRRSGWTWTCQFPVREGILLGSSADKYTPIHP